MSPEGYLSVAEGFTLINFKIEQCYPLHFRARRNGGTGCTAETLKPLPQVRQGVWLLAAATAACAEVPLGLPHSKIHSENRSPVGFSLHCTPEPAPAARRQATAASRPW